MEIVDTASGQTHHIVVSPVSKQELKLLTRAKYSFDWRVAAKTYALFKFTIEDQGLRREQRRHVVRKL